MKKSIPYHNSDRHQARLIAETIIDRYGGKYLYSEVKELITTIQEKVIGSSDEWIDFDGMDFRIIAESDIWEIYVEEIKNIVEDCYSDVIKLDKIPDFIAVEIDWEQMAKNAYVDGYGHTFAGYDGEENEAAGYCIFRTN